MTGVYDTTRGMIMSLTKGNEEEDASSSEVEKKSGITESLQEKKDVLSPSRVSKTAVLTAVLTAKQTRQKSRYTRQE